MPAWERAVDAFRAFYAERTQALRRSRLIAARVDREDRAHLALHFADQEVVI
jgi:hypothetical protein